jgi:hypothetical protein
MDNIGFKAGDNIVIIEDFTPPFGGFMFRNLKGQKGKIEDVKENTAWVTVNYDLMEIPHSKIKVI